MRLLLDTHTLVWWWEDDRRLSTAARRALADSRVALVVSAVTAWELATKWRIGKPVAPGYEPDGFLPRVWRLGCELLPISPEHAHRGGVYDSEHRDPFDRLLAAQAELEELRLVTGDRAFKSFPVETLW